MSTQLLSKYINLHQLPFANLEQEAHENPQITVGDLHSNAMKLIAICISHGIIKSMTASDHDRLVQLTRLPPDALTKEHLNEFDAILSRVTFHPHTLIRLLGDELADRGSNDYFILKILEKLHEHQVPIEIILSNHALEFIEAYETKPDFQPHRMTASNHTRSMKNLQHLINKGLITHQEVMSLVSKAYKPVLKAISYSLDEDQKAITIYSHAGIGLNTIYDLAQELSVPYQDQTATELASCINAINQAYQQHVQNNTVHTLYDQDSLDSVYYSKYYDLTDDPVAFIACNRNYDELERPAVYHGYCVNFAHGHDSHDPEQGHIYNLENTLGKGEHHFQGNYSVLCSKKDMLVDYQFKMGLIDIHHSFDASEEQASHLTAGLKNWRRLTANHHYHLEISTHCNKLMKRIPFPIVTPEHRYHMSMLQRSITIRNIHHLLLETPNSAISNMLENFEQGKGCDRRIIVAQIMQATLFDGASIMPLIAEIHALDNCTNNIASLIKDKPLELLPVIHNFDFKYIFNVEQASCFVLTVIAAIKNSPASTSTKLPFLVSFLYLTLCNFMFNNTHDTILPVEVNYYDYFKQINFSLINFRQHNFKNEHELLLKHHRRLQHGFATQDQVNIIQNYERSKNHLENAEQTLNHVQQPSSSSQITESVTQVDTAINNAIPIARQKQSLSPQNDYAPIDALLNNHMFSKASESSLPPSSEETEKVSFKRACCDV